MSGHFDRMAVFGDVGGQVGAFRHQLGQLGIDPQDPVIPDGLLIVQVGDLVSMTGSTSHRNLDTVALAAALAARNPGRYLQLLGNHELGALGGAGRPGWHGAADPELQDLLGTVPFLAAVAVSRPGRIPLLLTHAGVSVGRWHSMGRPALPHLVRSLNRQAGSRLMTTRRPGRLVTGVTDDAADEQWAEVNFELYTPWLEHRQSMPWVQVHGHASPWSWGLGDWWPDTPADIRKLTVLNPAARISFTTAPGRYFVSVNWELTERDGEADSAPLLISLGQADRIVVG